MYDLKKTIFGCYRSEDVNMLIKKIKEDYEACLKQQKQRILELREENRRLSAAAEQYRLNAQYFMDVILEAEQSAKMIREQAQIKSLQLVAQAEKKCLALRAEAELCSRRLMKLKKAVESVYLAACKAADTQCAAPDDAISSAAHRVLSVKMH